MGEFLVGVKEKYPAPLLKDRITVEGNVISCFFKDMLLLDDVKLEQKNFLSADGFKYFAMLKALRDKGFYSLDEVTIRSNLPEHIVEQFDDMGGWDVIQHQIDIINTDNFDTYLDILYRENILVNMYNDGFNLIDPIDIQGKSTVPLKLFRRCTAEQVLDWYEARMSDYGCGYSNKVLEEESIDFTDEWIENCKEGLENGVPFESAGLDVNFEEINVFPFLSRQTLGFRDGTLSMIGGFSSVGKSSWAISIIMAMLEQDRKVLVISNEEDVSKFKIKFLVWLLAKRNRYYKLTKKKLTVGDIDEEGMKEVKDIQAFWNKNYKGKIKVISVTDADMSVVKKKIRENVLKYGYDFVFYDTFKIQETDFEGNRTDLSLIRDSRTLHKLAKKYNIIIMASIQLAEHMKSKLFLDASCLSNSKQVKEILEQLFLMRNVYPEELDPKSKLFIHPFQLKKVDGKWVEEPVELDPTGVYRLLFVEKNRGGNNSSDTGVAYVLKYAGQHSIFREVAQARPHHGSIQ